MTTREIVHDKRRAFTLVELLVVLGIIAVLVAVTFPVMGAAKESALKTVCASNFRQAYLASSLYISDYDDTFMPVNHQPAEEPNSKNDRTWVQMLLPYVGSYGNFLCPSDTSYRQNTQASFDRDLVPGDTYSRYYTASLHTNLGYNYLYLAPIVRTGQQWAAEPHGAGQVANPNATLMYVDSVWDLDDTGRPVGGGNWLVVPPCRYRLARGQVVDSFQVVGRQVYGPLGWSLQEVNSPLRYGGAWPWHTGTITVIRVDGALGALSPRQLSAGCNVQENWNGFIDTDDYVWSMN
jgi:prepilin-type N-terminal cleavage/methylation domain-containing protein